MCGDDRKNKRGEMKTQNASAEGKREQVEEKGMKRKRERKTNTISLVWAAGRR